MFMYYGLEDNKNNLIRWSDILYQDLQLDVKDLFDFGGDKNVSDILDFKISYIRNIVLEIKTCIQNNDFEKLNDIIKNIDIENIIKTK